MGWWRREFTCRWSPRGAFRTLLIAALAATAIMGTAYLFRRSILTTIGRQLIVEDTLAPSGAIVVLSGGSPERELEAADLYTSGIAPIVVLPHDPERHGVAAARERGVAVETDLEFRRRLLTDLGVPGSAIVIPAATVSSTVEEARVVVDWALATNVRSLVVVTSAFHTGRAALTYRRVIGRRDVVVRMRAARAGSYRADSWWHSRVDMRDALFEWQKQLLYRVWY